MTATVKGIFSARRILKEFNPDVVIGVGGYASFPTVMRRHTWRISAIDHGTKLDSRSRQSNGGSLGGFRGDYGSENEIYIWRSGSRDWESRPAPVQIHFRKSASTAIHGSCIRGQPGGAIHQSRHSRKPAVPFGLEDEYSIRASDRREAGWRKSERLMPRRVSMRMCVPSSTIFTSNMLRRISLFRVQAQQRLLKSKQQDAPRF